MKYAVTYKLEGITEYSQHFDTKADAQQYAAWMKSEYPELKPIRVVRI